VEDFEDNSDGTIDEGDTIIDVHGAGYQRSNPKTNNAIDYPNSGNGPQGDLQRVFNHVRLVRDIPQEMMPNPNSNTDGDG